MERLREGFYQKGTAYQQDVFSRSMVDIIVIKLHNTCTSQQAGSARFECLSSSCCAVSP